MQQHRAAPLHAFPPQLKAGHGPTIYSRADTAPPPWVCLQPHLTRPQSCPPRSPGPPASQPSPSVPQQPSRQELSQQNCYSPASSSGPRWEPTAPAQRVVSLACLGKLNHICTDHTGKRNKPTIHGPLLCSPPGKGTTAAISTHRH